jgi:ABC-type Fe3+/spermidine/putrescine transport system ATPase subunit
MSDRIGIIFEGELVQMGSFDEIYNFPVDLRTAEFAGRINRVPAAHATVLGLDSTGTSDKEIVFRAEELEVDPAPEGPGTIRAVYPTGPLSTLEIDLWGLPLYAIGKNGKLAPGDHVTCTVRRVLPI